MPGVSNVRLRLDPRGYDPRSKWSALVGENTLCPTSSLLGKATRVPASTAITCGWNTRFRWSTLATAAGGVNVFPGIFAR